MSWHYQIVKSVETDFEGNVLSEKRNGAPLYGLFEVYCNKDGSIWARTETPELEWDSYLELEDEMDPDSEAIKQFRWQLMAMLSDTKRYPVLTHPIQYAKADHEKEETQSEEQV